MNRKSHAGHNATEENRTENTLLIFAADQNKAFEQCACCGGAQPLRLCFTLSLKNETFSFTNVPDKRKNVSRFALHRKQQACLVSNDKERSVWATLPSIDTQVLS